MKGKKEHKLCIRRYTVICSFCLALAAGMHAGNALADETGDFGGENETPSYANPAQAAHAASLAEAAASQPDESTAAALSAVEQAEADLAEAEQNGIQEQIDQALENLAVAQEAYADLIAEKTGVISEEIMDMRSIGMGWGQIARELGVHPGLLGLGHTKNKHGAYAEADMDEMAEATSRNTRSGWSNGHGVGLNAGVQGTSRGKVGYAYGHAKNADKGKGKENGNQGGISGASGLSSSSSGPGNSGQGGNSDNGRGNAGRDGSPGNSDKGGDKGNNKGGNSGNNGKGGGKGK